MMEFEGQHIQEDVTGKEETRKMQSSLRYELIFWWQARKREAKFMRMIKIKVIGKGKALAKLDDRNPKIRESFFGHYPLRA